METIGHICKENFAPTHIIDIYSKVISLRLLILKRIELYFTYNRSAGTTLYNVCIHIV